MNNPSNIKKSQQHCFGSWFGLTEFLVMGNWQSSVVHFATLYQGRIGRAMFHHLWWHGPKCHLVSPKGLGKLWLLFAFVLRWAPLGPFLHTPSSCQDLQFRFCWLLLCRCSLALLCSWQSADDFHAQFEEFLQCFLQFCLLLAILISLHQWHFLFLQKNVSPTCKLLFSSSIIPVNLHSPLSILFPLFPSLVRNLMFVHCSNLSSTILTAAHQNTRRQ